MLQEAKKSLLCKLIPSVYTSGADCLHHDQPSPPVGCGVLFDLFIAATKCCNGTRSRKCLPRPLHEKCQR